MLEEKNIVEPSRYDDLLRTAVSAVSFKLMKKPMAADPCGHMVDASDLPGLRAMQRDEIASCITCRAAVDQYIPASAFKRLSEEAQREIDRLHPEGELEELKAELTNRSHALANRNSLVEANSNLVAKWQFIGAGVAAITGMLLLSHFSNLTSGRVAQPAESGSALPSDELTLSGLLAVVSIFEHGLFDAINIALSRLDLVYRRFPANTSCADYDLEVVRENEFGVMKSIFSWISGVRQKPQWSPAKQIQYICSKIAEFRRLNGTSIREYRDEWWETDFYIRLSAARGNETKYEEVVRQSVKHRRQEALQETYFARANRHRLLAEWLSTRQDLPREAGLLDKEALIAKAIADYDRAYEITLPTNEARKNFFLSVLCNLMDKMNFYPPKAEFYFNELVKVEDRNNLKEIMMYSCRYLINFISRTKPDTAETRYNLLKVFRLYKKRYAEYREHDRILKDLDTSSSPLYFEAFPPSTELRLIAPIGLPDPDPENAWFYLNKGSRTRKTIALIRSSIQKSRKITVDIENANLQQLFCLTLTLNDTALVTDIVRDLIFVTFNVSKPFDIEFARNAGMEGADELGQQTYPLHLAARSEHASELMALLLDAGATVNHQDAQGRTALHYATNVEAISVLLNNQANPAIEDRMGLTPLCFAAKEGRTAVVQFFVEEHFVTEKDMQKALQIAQTAKNWAMKCLILTAIQKSDVSVGNGLANTINGCVNFLNNWMNLFGRRESQSAPEREAQIGVCLAGEEYLTQQNLQA